MKEAVAVKKLSPLRTTVAMGMAWAWLSASAILFGQPIEIQLPQSDRADFDLGAPGTLIASVRDDAERTVVIGGFLDDPAASCQPARQAVIGKRTAEGELLWQRSADASLGKLFANTGFDARYVLSSSVRGLTLDPLSGHVYAVGEALVGWQDESCQAGVATALATWVLELDADGSPVHDAYLGPEPDGPPAVGVGCEERCAPHRFAQSEGRGIELDPSGDVLVTGWLKPPFGSTAQEAQIFVARLNAELERQIDQDIFFPKFPRGDGLVPKSCEVSTPEYLVVGLEKTLVEGTRSSLSELDGCILLASPESKVEDQWGLEVILYPSNRADPYLVKVDIHGKVYFDQATVKLTAENKSGESQVLQVIKPLAREQFHISVEIDKPSIYFDLKKGIFLRLLIEAPSVERLTKGRDAVAIDRLVLQTEP